MSDTAPAEPPPEPPPEATTAAQARDQAESQARLVYIAALAYVVLHDSDTEPGKSSVLWKTAKALATRLWRSVRWQSTSRQRPPAKLRDTWIEGETERIVEVARTEAGRHAETITKRARTTNPDVTDRVVAAMVRSDDAWARAAARTAATRLASETAMSMRAVVEGDTGAEHSYMWISRGDARVRELHRELHGRVRPGGVPFHAWPSGQVLRFPGDPEAPLDQQINCRCALLMVPTKDAKLAEDVFSAPSEDFDVPLAASAAPDQGTLDLMAEMGGW